MRTLVAVVLPFCISAVVPNQVWGLEEKTFLLNPTGDGHYTVTDIGNLGGTRTHPNGLNNMGQVIAESTDVTGWLHSFFWSQTGGMIELPTLGADSRSLASGINDLGQVVGFSDHGDSSFGRAFLWTQAGGITQLAGTGDGVLPAGINNQGMVSGNYLYKWGSVVVGRSLFLWTESAGLTEIVSAYGSSGGAINDAGVVAGNIIQQDRYPHACQWSAASGMVDLGTLPGDGFSYAADINDSGKVVGRSADSTNQRSRAFLWTPQNGLEELVGFWAQAEAMGINNSGAIVGACSPSNIVTAGNVVSAAIWVNGTATNLNNLLVGSNLPYLTYASNINDEGQILAVYDSSFATPEPATLCLLAVAGLLIARRRQV